MHRLPKTYGSEECFMLHALSKYPVQRHNWYQNFVKQKQTETDQNASTVEHMWT
jgi:hypothetical protein